MKDEEDPGHSLRNRSISASSHNNRHTRSRIHSRRDPLRSILTMHPLHRLRDSPEDPPERHELPKGSVTSATADNPIFNIDTRCGIHARHDPLPRIIPPKHHQHATEEVDALVDTRGTGISEEEEDKLTGSGLFWSQANWEDFCRTTYMHGWFFIVDYKMGYGYYGRCSRSMWVIFVVVSFIVAIALVISAYSVFEGQFVSITDATERESWHSVRFPSVTICNLNQARRSYLMELGYNGSLQPIIDNIYTGYESGGESEVQNSHIFKTDGYRIWDMYLFRSKYSEVARLPPTPFLDNVEDSFDFLRMAAMQKVGQSMIMRAKYKTVEKPLDEFTVLHPFFETAFGYCSHIRPHAMFKMNYAGKSFHQLLDIRRTANISKIMLGSEKGLNLLLDAEVYDYGWSAIASEGFRVSVQHYLNLPGMDFSPIDVRPGFNTHVALLPTVTHTTKAAKTRFNPLERDCRYDSEFSFRHLPIDRFRFGFHNCILDGAYDKLEQTCQCRRALGAIAKVSGSDNYYSKGKEKLKFCLGHDKSLACFHDIFKHVSRIDSARDAYNATKVCLNACNDETYETTVTESRFPNRNALIGNTELFCVVYRKIKAICRETFRRLSLEERYPGLCAVQSENSEGVCTSTEVMVTEEFFYADEVKAFGSQLGDEGKSRAAWNNVTLHNAVYLYARENLALLNVFLKDTRVRSIERDEKEALLWFMANVGGLFGLSTGCSVVTIAELIYFICLYLLYVRRRITNRRIDQLQAKRDRECLFGTTLTQPNGS